MRLAGMGNKTQYIDTNVERLEKAAINQDIDMDGLEKSTNDYLAGVRAKHG